MPLDPGSLESGPEFVRIMELYGIRPKDLGISSRYKLMLKRGEKRPSKQLIEKLLQLINLKNTKTRTGSGGRLAWTRTPAPQAGGPGFKSRPPHHSSIN